MKYSPLLRISYDEFGNRFYDKTVEERIPIDGMIELTRRCNLKCAYCYAVPDSSKKELTYRQIRPILNEITKCGCLWLAFTGGDPLIRDDFLDIYAYAKKKGLIISLLTNGTLITRRIADYFKKYPPWLIDITLNGITKKTYEDVTGVPGSFERCLGGIQLLIERNIPLQLKTTVTTLNIDELGEIKKYVESLGIDFRFDAVLHPAVDGSKTPCEFRISPAEVVKLDLADQKRSEKLREFFRKAKGPSQADKLYNCGAGVNSFHINPYGELGMCILPQETSYNLCKGSFIKGWYDFIPKIREQKRKRKSRCLNCSLFTLCGPCPDWAQLEIGDRQKPIDHMCRITRLRAEAFGREVKRKWEAESDKKDFMENHS